MSGHLRLQLRKAVCLGITDSALRILEQVSARAGERGLHVLDGSSIVWLTFWSLLLWERKVGRIALENAGADPFELARGVDCLLTEEGEKQPVVYDQKRGTLVLARSGEPLQHCDIAALLEPLLKTAELEARELGHNYIGTEHLVLAIVRVADQTLAALLWQHGVAHAALQQAVRELLGS